MESRAPVQLAPRVRVRLRRLGEYEPTIKILFTASDAGGMQSELVDRAVS
jgi:hypothetical protein